MIPPPIGICRSTAAVEFFEPWEYNFLGWNCEHLARLVTTGKARCYQSKAIWWACNLNPQGDHKSAARLFEEYLLKTDPEAALPGLFNCDQSRYRQAVYLNYCKVNIAAALATLFIANRMLPAETLS